jgi:hypothetical protein
MFEIIRDVTIVIITALLIAVIIQTKEICESIDIIHRELRRVDRELERCERVETVGVSRLWQ